MWLWLSIACKQGSLRTINHWWVPNQCQTLKYIIKTSTIVINKNNKIWTYLVRKRPSQIKVCRSHKWKWVNTSSISTGPRPYSTRKKCATARLAVGPVPSGFWASKVLAYHLNRKISQPSKRSCLKHREVCRCILHSVINLPGMYKKKSILLLR